MSSLTNLKPALVKHKGEKNMTYIMKVLNFLSIKQREFNTPTIRGERIDLYPLLIDFYADSFVISVSKKDEFLKKLK